MISRIARHREFVTLVGVVFLLIVVGLFNASFVSPSNLARVLNSAVILFLLAAGEAPVIITRNIDASIGAILVLSGVLGALALRHGVAIPLVILIVAGSAALMGVLNGVFVAYGHVPPIVATLGTLAAFRGVSFLITGGFSIEDIPQNYTRFGSAQVIGVPLLVWVGLALAALLGILMAKTQFGRHFYATGGNPVGARLIGIPVNRMVVTAYAISGLFAGLAALVFMAQFGSVSNQAGVGMELQAIAAAVVGGVSLSGGVGTIFGAIIGAFFITSARSSLSFMGIPGFWSDTAIGVILLIALFADAKVRHALDVRRLEQRYASSGEALSEVGSADVAFDKEEHAR